MKRKKKSREIQKWQMIELLKKISTVITTYVQEGREKHEYAK